MIDISINNEEHEIHNGYPVMKKIVSFLTAGLVDYSDVDDGKYLLRKEAIERMLPTLEGRPLVIGHQPIDVDTMDDVAVGYITKGYWNPDTGSFDCDVLVKDPEILNPERNSVSCAYVATEFGKGGRYSGIEYDAEILNGNFTHIALVENPRYNDARILVNGLNGGKDMIKRFFSNASEDKKEENNEEQQKENEGTKTINPEDVVKIGEDEVTVQDLISCYKNSCKKNEDEKKAEDEEKENEDAEEEQKENEDTEEKQGEDEVKENGDDVKITEELKNYINTCISNALKNSEEKQEENCGDAKGVEKSNALAVTAIMRDFSQAEATYETRAERIAASNKKYSL